MSNVVGWVCKHDVSVNYIMKNNELHQIKIKFMLKIYNSHTGQKEIFKPIEPGKVKLYVCGMTVYDYCHLGHARTLIAFDVVVRYLRFRGFDVRYVRNITDIDDKIIKRAQENEEDFQVLTARFIDALHEDCRALGLLTPDEEPCATQFMDQIIQMIQKIMDNGYAYVGLNGDVYYDVRRFKSYGELSHRDLDKLRSGARIEVSEAKNDPLDFVLWKLAKPAEPSWDSPWGKGRPGWHIECSSMSMSCLASQIDIHGGGKDLIFPHHENEIAQSEAATGKKFVNVWMHGGHLQIDKTKMSKSLGNFFTIREILEKHTPEVVRYFVISSHYRSQLNYSEESLYNAKLSLIRLYTALRGLSVSHDVVEQGEYQKRFIEALDDDFNTPEALAVLFDLAKEINKLKLEDKKRAIQLSGCLKQLGSVLGILQEEPETFLKNSADLQLSHDEIQQIEQLILARNEARKNKEWARADQFRDELAKLNVVLEDSSIGTKWRVDNRS